MATGSEFKRRLHYTLVMLRLVAYAPDGVKRFPIHRSSLLIGSLPECDIELPYTGVAQQHARVTYDGTTLRIEDLGSRRGLLVSGRKVRETALEVLDEIRVGVVTLLVEDVTPEVSPAVEIPLPVRPTVPRVTSSRLSGHLARLSDWVLADAESRVTSESLVSDLLDDFGGGALFLLIGDLEAAVIKLAVASEQAWLSAGGELVDQIHTRQVALGERDGTFVGTLGGAPAWICHHAYRAVDRTYVLATAFPRFAPVEDWSPSDALRAAGNLLILGLVHHVGWYEPILPGAQAQPDLVLDPLLVVGESPAMKRVLEELKGAIEPAVNVLLRGEAGVGKEMLARSLHLSGPRRHGPFVLASGAGAKPSQIEADLFGAEISGRDGPIRREGKLWLARGGTLYLDDVDELPLEVQARLVRFLRSGEVEPTGSLSAEKVDVRLVVGSRVPLEEQVACDKFRVDLAYRLSRVAIDVPPLRDRKDDLPLLVQSYVNRFCHESGTRLLGITTKALAALLAYDYPGNLAELENVIRQVVTLCPPGRPVDVSLLPEKVRSGPVHQAARVDSATDLDLEHLLGTAEQAAIREALRRSRGNKAQAARLLGLSRNGLAIKMERHGLSG